MTVLFADFETRSVVDLRRYGLWNYARDPSTRPYCLGYAFDDEAPQLWWYGEKMPQRVVDHVAEGGTFVAHNAAFELDIWNNVLVSLGWPVLKPEQVVCTMARAYAMSLPPSLENVCPALGLGDMKDAEGHALMLRMCAPMNKKAVALGGKPTWLIDQDAFTFLKVKRTRAWAYDRLGSYCKDDVAAEREVFKRTMPLSTFEKRVWLEDYRINQRGILLDKRAVQGAIVMRDRALANLDARMSNITGGAVQVCSAVIALKEWLQDFGIFAKSLAKEPLEEILLDETLPEVVREALLTRQESGRATSVAKLDMASRIWGEDGRVRNLFQYHGAGTGRWAGRALQPHNMPRDLPDPKTVDFIMSLIRMGDADLMDAFGYPPLTTISKLLRGFMIPAPGSSMIGGDWSNVEGRGVAWLAGEEWKLDAFREYDAGTGPDLYVKTYAESFKVPIEGVTKAQRRIGKVEELAFGYQGGVGASQSMGAKYGVHMEDAFADELKNRWRSAHLMVVQLWSALQGAAKRAIRNPGIVTSTADPENRHGHRFDGLPLPPRDRQVRFVVAAPGPFLWARLPSGRNLCYPYPKMLEGMFGSQITYMSKPSQDDWRKGQVVKWPGNSRNWARISTYGGKLTENVTQAICRDILAEAIVAAADKGYKTVLHVHDEPVIEGLLTEEDRVIFQGLMRTQPAWAKGFPINADCWIGDRYRKE